MGASSSGEERRGAGDQERVLSDPVHRSGSKVNTFDDRGMWGLAFDPNFSSNGFVYLTYTFENAGDPNDAGPGRRG